VDPVALRAQPSLEAAVEYTLGRAHARGFLEGVPADRVWLGVQGPPQQRADGLFYQGDLVVQLAWPISLSVEHEELVLICFDRRPAGWGWRRWLQYFRAAIRGHRMQLN